MIHKIIVILLALRLLWLIETADVFSKALEVSDALWNQVPTRAYMMVKRNVIMDLFKLVLKTNKEGNASIRGP